MQKLLYILVSLILFGCARQKTLIEYKHTTDTIIVSKTQTIYKPVNDTTYIENPCDSLGILNRFYAKIAIPFGQVVINSQNGKIKAVVKTDKLVSSNDSLVAKHSQIQTINKEIIKYRIPIWAIYLIIAETFIILAYLFIKIYVN